MFTSVNNISTVCRDSFCDFTLNVFTQLNKAIKKPEQYMLFRFVSVEVSVQISQLLCVNLIQKFP